KGPVPLLSGDLLERVEAPLVGGIVDEHVDVLEGLDRVPDQLTAAIGAGQIATKQLAATAGFPHQPLSLACIAVLALIQIRDRHIGALAREGESYGATDAGVAAGDQRLLALQARGASIGALSVVRLWIHVLALARHRLPLRLERGFGSFNS